MFYWSFWWRFCVVTLLFGVFCWYKGFDIFSYRLNLHTVWFYIRIGVVFLCPHVLQSFFDRKQVLNALYQCYMRSFGSIRQQRCRYGLLTGWRIFYFLISNTECPLPRFAFFSGRLVNKDCHPGLCLADTFSRPIRNCACWPDFIGIRQ